MALQTADTEDLHVAFYEYGPSDGWPVVFTYDFPYDVHTYDQIVSKLVNAGARVLAPYLRGFGPTHLLSEDMIPSRQQSALANDMVDLLEGRGITKAILAGFNWRGLASGAAEILFPDRQEPSHPILEAFMWYKHICEPEGGRRCLEPFRHELCLQQWQQWSPTHPVMDPSPRPADRPAEEIEFEGATLHVCRYALGIRKPETLQLLEDEPDFKFEIPVPTISLDGEADPWKTGDPATYDEMFSGLLEREKFDVGHVSPLEAPTAFVEAVIKMHTWTEQTANP